MPQIPMMKRMLKTAEPTIVPTPMSESAKKRPVARTAREIARKQVFFLFHVISCDVVSFFNFLKIACVTWQSLHTSGDHNTNTI